MQAFTKQIRGRPSLFVLTGIVGATVGTAICLGHFEAKNSRQLVFKPREEPFPYLRRDNYAKPNFFSVSQKSEEQAGEHYDLLDILNGKYSDS